MNGCFAGAGALAAVMLLSASVVGAVDEHHADVCLEFGAASIDADTWDDRRVAMVAVAAERSELFPAPGFDERGPAVSDGSGTYRMLIHAGHAD